VTLGIAFFLADAAPSVGIEDLSFAAITAEVMIWVPGGLLVDEPRAPFLVALGYK
jgi:hypothetical protein